MDSPDPSRVRRLAVRRNEDHVAMRAAERTRGRAVTTLVEVANAAQVSPSTVSRILNGTARVSPEKREAVETAIAALDFRPNLLARGLRQGRGMTVGILTQQVDSPFFTASLKGIEEGLAGSGFAPLIASGHWDAREEKERVALLLSRRVDGLIILTGHLPNEEIQRFARSVPIVVTGRKLPSGRVVSMASDHVHGGYLATRHLVELGHRHIAHLKGPELHEDARDRLRGYRQALKEAQIPFDPGLVVAGGFEASSGLVALDRLMASQRPFTAIFAANDESAYGARLGLYRRGIRVPEDVSLVGFDDLASSLFTTPPLTTVRQPLFEVGKLAALALLALVAGRPPTGEVPPPLRLVVRETTRTVH
jgi:LacI family transcriptional regulator